LFEKCWSDLQPTITELRARAPEQAPKHRSERDMLVEILDVLRSLARPAVLPESEMLASQLENFRARLETLRQDTTSDPMAKRPRRYADVLTGLKGTEIVGPARPESDKPTQ